MNAPHGRPTPLRRLVSVGALALLVVTLTACDAIFGPGNPGPPAAITEMPRQLTATEIELLSSSNRFGIGLLAEVLEEEPDRTHFLSPLSAAMVLVMIMNGAEGETYDAIRQTLRLHDVAESEINEAFASLVQVLGSVDPTVSFQLGNGFWYRDGVVALHDEYVARIEEHFEAAVEGLDFDDPAAADAINAWVREASNGRIDEMAPKPIPWSWVAVAMNAIHFEADWTWQFDPDSTRTEPFHLSGGGTEPVPLMRRMGELSYHWNQRFRAVELPYGGEAYAMTLIVPEGENTVAGVLEGLADGGWEALTENLVEGRAHVALPRFELEWEKELNDPLTVMGMGPAFQPGADWSRLFQNDSPVLTQVFQKSYVRVDEEGTEAAAVTRADFGRSGPFELRADRPFLFVIRERLSGAALFMGAYMAPPD